MTAKLRPIPGLIPFFSLTGAHTVSLAGAGGKTTLMYALAEESRLTGSSVLVTTTTHILRPAPEEADFLYLENGLETVKPLPGKIIVYAAEDPTNPEKLAAPSRQKLTDAAGLFDLTLCEADGSKRLPFKACRPNEPILLPDSDINIQLAGLSAIGKPLSRCCHRPELACEYLKAEENTILTPRLAALLLASPLASMRDFSPAKTRIILNQAELPDALPAAIEIAAHLRRLGRLVHRTELPPIYAVSLQKRIGCLI